MKKICYVFAFLAVIALAAGCKKPEKAKSKVGGLLNFTILMEDQEYKADTQGPYEPGADIIVHIPSTYENPTDLTALECYASFANNCYADPYIPAVCDFSKPVPVTVVNADGVAQTNNIVVKYAYPRIKMTPVWQKTSTELGLSYHFQMNLAADEQYLYIIDTQQNNGKTVKVYDRLTGTFVKDLPDLPGVCYVDVHVDDAGNLVATRFNLYNAGFRMEVYNPGSGQWQRKIDHVKSETLTVPENLGWKASVCGDVNGNAYVYATIRGSFEYYEWKIVDGVVTEDSPRKKNVAAVEPTSSSSTVMVLRESASDDSDIWYSVEGGNVAGSGSYFHCVTADYDQIPVSIENFGHRVQNAKVFSLKEDKWMAVAGSGAAFSYSGSHLAVFDVTKKDNYSMVPSDSGYAFDFRLFKEPGINGQCTARTSGLDVWADRSANEAYIYYANASKGLGDEKDLPNSVVQCYKLTYSE